MGNKQRQGSVWVEAAGQRHMTSSVYA